MERIRLPVRTVSTRAAVTIPVGVGVILLMALWLADVAILWYADNVAMSNFRQIVMSRRNVEVRNADGVVVQEWWLFLGGEAGTRRAIPATPAAPGAELAMGLRPNRAFLGDPWNGSLRYLYARGLWREYLGPVNDAGKTVTGRFDRAKLPLAVETHLRAAIRCEPMNRYYRQTLAEVLAATGGPSRRDEVRALVEKHPPMNAYGHLRAAEMLAADAADRNRTQLLRTYIRAMSLVPSDVMSGIFDLSSQERIPGTPPPPLSPLVVARCVDGLLKNVADYSMWSAADDYRDLPPEVHFLVAEHLRQRNLADAAIKERQAVVDSVEDRLKTRSKVTWRRMLWELVNPFAGSPDLAKRLLTAQEVRWAALVLRDTNRLDEAIQKYRVQIAGAPEDLQARLDFAEALRRRATALDAQARVARTAGKATEATDLYARAKEAYREMDAQLSYVLDRDPLSAEVIEFRKKLPTDVVSSGSQ